MKTNIEKVQKLKSLLSEAPAKLTHNEIVLLQVRAGYKANSLNPIVFKEYQKIKHNTYIKRRVKNDLSTLNFQNTDSSLSNATTDQLIKELRMRGFSGKLISKQEIEL